MNREDSSKHRYGYVIRTLSVVHCIGLVHLAPPAPTSSNVQQVCCNLIGCCEELWLVLIGSGLRAWGHEDYHEDYFFSQHGFSVSSGSQSIVWKWSSKKREERGERKEKEDLCIIYVYFLSWKIIIIVHENLNNLVCAHKN